MRAVLFRLRCLLRSQWKVSAGLTLVVAVLVAVVLTLAAGALRTLSAPDRYASSRGASFDAMVLEGAGRGTRSRADELARLPGAASVRSITFVFGGLTGPAEGEPTVPGTSVFSGSIEPTGERLVAGREPDATKANEFVATRTFIDAMHAAIGDQFDLATLTQDQADAAGFDSGQPAGPALRAVLVGIIDGPSELDDPSPLALFSPALLLDNPTIGVAISIDSITLRPGVTLDDFRAQIAASLPRSGELNVEPFVSVSENVRAAVDAQGQGLRLLAILSAIAAAAALTQLITRQVRLSPSERGRLRVLGVTRGQMVAESTGRAALPIALGVVIGAAVSTLLSGIFPTGFVRRIELHPGYRVDATVLVVGALGAVVTLLVSTAVALAASEPRSEHRRPSAMLDAVARRAHSATAATGVRFAFARRARDSGSVRSAVIGLTLTIAGLVGAVSFASSLDRLIDEPARFGRNYDAQFDNGAAELSPALLAQLNDDPDVAALTLYADGQARVGSQQLRLVAFEQQRGALAPEVLEGRLPASETEIALGRLTAHDLGVGVNDELDVDGSAGSLSVRVTGLVIVPNIGLNDGVGQGGVLTLAALRKLSSRDDVAPTPVVRLRSDAPADTLDRLSATTGVDAATGSPPPAIVNVSRVRSVPVLLAGLLAALAALTVCQMMITSLRNRRRDLALLRALGADTRWNDRVVHWLASSLSLLPAALGVPLGIVAGRFVFGAFADSLGTRSAVSVPWALLVAVVGGTVALANLAARLAARSGRRLTPAHLLQAE